MKKVFYQENNDYVIEKVFKELKSRVLGDSNLDYKLVKSAYDFANLAHKGQFRDSNEPYIIHPVKVACMVADLKMDSESIATALLHDVIEDTNASYTSIRKKFGSNIANMVQGVTKLNIIENKKLDIEKNKISNYRNLMCAISKDIRVLIIKLADRLHNMQTLSWIKNKEKRRKIAIETMDIHSALAERIGLHHYKNELQELAFNELYPYERQNIIDQLHTLRKKIGFSVQKITNKIEYSLRRQKLRDFSISWREKQACSIWRKLKDKKISFENLTDIFAFRVIVDTTDDCYKALYAIHADYHMVPGEFKDYISTPKTNGYQSLHTVIIGPEKKRIEVQIRTKKMHMIAEYGIAVHWQYKENILDKEIAKNFSWITQILEILQEGNNHVEMLKDSKMEISYNQVYCFDVKSGELIALSSGATVLDFAFHIDQELALNFQKAKVNNIEVSMQYKIQQGEQIEIFYSKKTCASELWLEFVQTGRAKSILKKYLNKRSYSFSEKLKDFSVNESVNKFKHLGMKKTSSKSKENLVIKFPVCCFPVSQDRALFLFKNGTNRCIIHRSNCSKLVELANKDMSNLQTVDWAKINKKSYSSKIILSISNEAENLKNFLDYLLELKINIKEIKAKAKSKCIIVIDISDLQELDQIIEKLNRLRYISNAERYCK